MPNFCRRRQGGWCQGGVARRGWRLHGCGVITGQRRLDSCVGDFLEDCLIPHLTVDEALLLPGQFPIHLLLKLFAAVDARNEGLSGNL